MSGDAALCCATVSTVATRIDVRSDYYQMIWLADERRSRVDLTLSYTLTNPQIPQPTKDVPRWRREYQATNHATMARKENCRPASCLVEVGGRVVNRVQAVTVTRVRYGYLVTVAHMAGVM